MGEESRFAGLTNYPTARLRIGQSQEHGGKPPNHQGAFERDFIPGDASMDTGFSM